MRFFDRRHQKKNILDVIKPQIFFADQLGHLEPAAGSAPCVHIPFGVRNRAIKAEQR
ncbi:MAG: 5'-nucleotidase [Pseudomonadota bacterium]